MALIPPFFMDCVVAIGADDNKGKRKWIASGFLYGTYAAKNENNQKSYWVYLVTNRHVFEGLSKVYLRFNPQADEPAREYDIDLSDKNGNLLWSAHPNNDIDIAVIPINFNLLKEHAMQVNYFHNDDHSANVDKMNAIGITEGDFAYVLGFPMGLIGDKRNTVIVRSGSIARIRDALAKSNNTFLVDAFIFPGNSGGPVVTKPDAMSIQGTKAQTAAYLIGIVRAFVSYQDVAISQQTHRPRVVFEENSGLAEVHPMDLVDETIRLHRKKLSPDTTTTPAK